MDSRSPSDAFRHPLPVGAVAIVGKGRSSKFLVSLCLALFGLVGMACWLAVQAQGQEAAENPAQGQYDSVPMHQALSTDEAVKKVIAGAKSFCAGAKNNTSLANGYFRFYVPAKMTGPGAMQEMTMLMKDVNRLLVTSQRSKDTAVSGTVTAALMFSMKALATGNYNPPARINAALLLGRLDSRPANTSARRPPVPHLDALRPLIDLYADESNSDGLRVAALLGLKRQVILGLPQIPAQTQTELTTLMTALLDGEAPPNRSERIHAYLQRYAVDILDRIGSNQNKDLGVKLISISTAPEKPELIALYSASKIGSMGDSLKGQIADPENVLKSWSRLAYTSFQTEAERLKGLKRADPYRAQPVKPADVLQPKETEADSTARGAGDMEMDGEMDGEMGMDMEMGGMGMEEGNYDEESDDDIGIGMGFSVGSSAEANPQPPEVLVSRRLLNKVLQQLQLGATGSRSIGMPKKGEGGLLVSVPEDKKQVVADWVTSMEEVITALNDDTLDDRKKYLEGLEAQVLVLAELAAIDAVAEKAKEAAEAEGKPDFSFEDDELAAPAAADPAAADPAAADPAAPVANPDAAAPADPAAADPTGGIF